MTLLRDEAGHQAQERTEQLIRSRSYWSTLQGYVTSHLKRCIRCIQAKMPYHKIRTPLGHLEASKPLECVAIDYTLLELASSHTDNVLVMDIFTKFTTAISTKDQTATTVAKALIKELSSLDVKQTDVNACTIPKPKIIS